QTQSRMGVRIKAVLSWDGTRSSGSRRVSWMGLLQSERWLRNNAPDRGFLDRLNDSFLGDDACNEAGRRDLEGGIVDLDALRSDGPAEAVGDLARIALLDGDGGAGGEGQVERAARRGDVERDAVSAGEHGHPVGADLVGCVAVGGDAVGPGEHQ